MNAPRATADTAAGLDAGAAIGPAITSVGRGTQLPGPARAPAAAGPGAGGSGFEDAVDQALLKLAYGRLRQSVALTVIVCLVFLALFWDYFPSRAKIVWIACLLTISALRFALWWAYQRANAPELDHPKWRRLFFASAVAAGLGWAFGPVMLMPPAGQVESMLLVLAVLAVSAVSMSAMGAQVAAMLSFQFCALVPSLLALAATGGAVEQLAAGVMLAGMVSLMIVGRASSEVTRSLIEADLRLSRAVADTSAARERAEAASDAKTRFLANMSHELRSPLNAVIGAAQLLRAGDNDPLRQQQLTEAIQRSGTNLLGLIDNILDLSRIESGQLQLVQQDFHLCDCVDAVLATAGLAARAKGLQLACIVDPQLPPWRRGDAAALRQVLLNLLGNAVKFTPSGEIVVRVERGEAPSGVRFRIRDTGVGIAPQALGHVFEPFRQGDEGAQKRYGGSGLGLAIVRQLIEAMGGDITVSSTQGQGSEFVLRLPLALASKTTPDADADAGSWRVAYVEPHPASAQALHSLLTRMGCEAVRCEDAQAVRDWCSSNRSAPGTAWLLLCNDDPRTPALLQLALRDLPAQRVIGMLGADMPDAKGPVQPAPVLPTRVIKPVLRASLASCFVRAQQSRSAAAPEPAAQGVASAADVVAGLQSPGHILVVEDDALNRTIVSRMLEHAGYRVSLAPDGQSALAMLREQRVDLVLMDWQMPDLDGLEVTRRLRAGAAGTAGQRVPIIALTANAFAEDRQACLEAGMNDFLSKPVLAASLVAAIARCLRVPPAVGLAGAGPAHREVPDAAGATRRLVPSTEQEP